MTPGQRTIYYKVTPLFGTSRSYTRDCRISYGAGVRPGTGHTPLCLHSKTKQPNDQLRTITKKYVISSCRQLPISPPIGADSCRQLCRKKALVGSYRHLSAPEPITHVILQWFVSQLRTIRVMIDLVASLGCPWPMGRV